MKDNLLHLLGGLALFALIAWTGPALWSYFIVGTVFGTLRELAQHSSGGLLRGSTWGQTFWDYADGELRTNRVIEALSWGLGSALAGLIF